MRFTFWLIAGIIFLNSCISNKQVLLLQHGDELEPVRDTVVRSYPQFEFNYKIQPQDILSVRFESLTPDEYNFFSRNQAQQNAANLTTGSALLIGELVDEQGEITFPVVGKVKVQGLTVFEIQQKLQQLANQYLEAPVVKVRLLNFRISVLGEVNHEGTVTFSNNRVSMLEAIAQAGGLSELADRSNIKVIRQLDHETQIFYVNLLDEDFLNSPYYYVYQNDVLIISPLRQRPFRKYFGPNLALVISALSLLVLTINLTR
ncbi:unnamed protein product [Phaeothamnion confervicola]